MNKKLPFYSQLKIFCVFNFRCVIPATKTFNVEFFPNYGILSQEKPMQAKVTIWLQLYNHWTELDWTRPIYSKGQISNTLTTTCMHVIIMWKQHHKNDSYILCNYSYHFYFQSVNYAIKIKLKNNQLLHHTDSGRILMNKINSYLLQPWLHFIVSGFKAKTTLLHLTSFMHTCNFKDLPGSSQLLLAYKVARSY